MNTNVDFLFTFGPSISTTDINTQSDKPLFVKMKFEESVLRGDFNQLVAELNEQVQESMTTLARYIQGEEYTTALTEQLITTVAHYRAEGSTNS
jgi:hypothetical protein